MRVGDIVSRKSYNNDVNFIIESISNDKAILSGLHYRLTADAFVNDLDVIGTRGVPDDLEAKESFQYEKGTESRGLMKNRFGWGMPNDDTLPESPSSDDPPFLSGKHFPTILHIDANEHYLNACLAQYQKFGLTVEGFSIAEEKQPTCILGLLTIYQPNILVITGHDSVSKNNEEAKTMDGYVNSKYFVESIKIARQFNHNYDELVIIAGGCKSYYEALIDAGANFASSPSRVLISITEPVNIACKMATTSIQKVLSMDNVAKVISSGFEGFGGIETRGQCREIKPRL